MDTREVDKNVESFREYLRQGQRWCGDMKVRWAEIRTLELTKGVIVFNLGILAFLGAMQEVFAYRPLLFGVVGVSSVSILLAFIYVWKVSVENINYLQAKYDAISESLKKLSSGFDEGFSYYQEKMAFIEGKLRGREKCWDWLQKISFWLFFLAILLTLVGIFI